MEFLSMSRDEVQHHVASSDSPRADRVTVGAAILQHDASGPSILLLKRNSDEKYYPNVFEIPGGKVEMTDSTVRDAIIREVTEETQLAVLDIAFPLSCITYTTEKLEKTPAGQEEYIKRHALQLSYVVTVEGTNFQVNEEEHSIGIWASRDSLDQIPITSEMKALVLEALDLEEGRFSTKTTGTLGEEARS
ncbi:MutT family protein [Colletotrichum tofieldiae]|uniref:MutT family protein n=1 Tax=Colletotrichum tofieldiae TaxID=708197 RepID=A0A166TS49_9PEZI|nr:MutT family protein [Colletotrichum tofieldiae]GKT56732.1 MutT family protein [Colletotrichum tofieldiae]